MIPILVTQGIILFQDTSLVFVVSLRDFMTDIVHRRPHRRAALVEMYVFRSTRLLRYLLHRLGPRSKRMRDRMAT